MANKNNNTPNKAPVVHHRVRTLFAALFGIAALWLVFFSFLIVWLNRTLTDTTTYVNTVAPLVTKPAIQNFVADKVDDQLLKDNSINDVANNLLPADQIAGKTPQQLTSEVKSVINSSILQIVKSPQFVSLWRTTNQSAHASLLSQLNSNSPQLTIDLSPLVNGIIGELKNTQLAPVASKIQLSSDAGVLNLKGQGIAKIHQYYKMFQAATLGIVAATVVCIVASIWLSVHHAKTLRRIAVGSAIISLLLAAVLELPALIKPSGDNESVAAGRAFAEALFHNLQLTAVIIGVLCIALAVGSKLYSRRHA